MKRLHFKDVTSTNDMAKSLVKAGEYDIVITSDFQSKGRGKQGAEWFGEREKDLFLSFTLPCPKEDRLFAYAIISAVGVRRALKTYGINANIKAPNDLYYKGKKLCGILCEAEFFEKKAYMIVGIGINVYSQKFPEWLNAVSILNINSNFNTDIRTLGDKIVEEVQKVYKEDFEKVQKEYNLFLTEI